MSTIVTLQMDADSQMRFNTLRESHYPAHLNRIAAHLTLFHALPKSEDVRVILQQEAHVRQPFLMRVSGVMSLGRGVAYAIESSELQALHKRLRTAYQPYLTPQDRQPLRPHVVVQNKVSGDQSKLLRAQLLAEFTPWEIKAEGLEWWNYLGGPWKLREWFRFG